MDACAACAACAKKARVAPPSGHIWTARPSAAVKTETDTLSGDDAPLIHMMNGVKCLPKPSVAPSVGPFGRDEGIADRGSRVRVRVRVRAPQSCFEKRQPSRSPSTHVEAARSMDRHVANGAPSTNESPSTHVEEVASSNKQFKDSKEKGKAFHRQLRAAPADVKALWENEFKDCYRKCPEFRYAFGISRTTWNTRMCFVVTCDCCFVAINIMTCGYRIEIQSCSD